MKRTAIKVEDTDSFPNGFLVWNVGIIVIIIVIDNEFIFLTLLPVLFYKIVEFQEYFQSWLVILDLWLIQGEQFFFLNKCCILKDSICSKCKISNLMVVCN